MLKKTSKKNTKIKQKENDIYILTSIQANTLDTCTVPKQKVKNCKTHSEGKENNMYHEPPFEDHWCRPSVCGGHV